MTTCPATAKRLRRGDGADRHLGARRRRVVARAPLGARSTVHVNRVAGDDNPLMLMRLTVQPLARTPFPLEWLIRV